MKKMIPFAAPRNWQFTDPDTGFEYSAPSKVALFRHIISYRRQNRLPAIKNLEIVVENFLCLQPANLGICEEAKLQRGLLETLRGGITLVENVLVGEKNMVSAEEAEKRAQICVGCPHNIFPDKGAFVAWSDALAEAAIGGKKTASYKLLGNCGICSCPLRVKTWVKGPFKMPKEQLVQLPDFCWCKK